MAQEIGVVSFFFSANKNCCHPLIFINPNPQGNIQLLIFQNMCFFSCPKNILDSVRQRNSNAFDLGEGGYYKCLEAFVASGHISDLPL